MTISGGILNPYATGDQNDAKNWKMAETLVFGYSSESTQRELANEYQHDKV